MPIKESGEMYLETIYVLSKTKHNVRSIDIADYLNYTKPSVSRAIGILKKQGYIFVDKDGYISLSESGLETAKTIYERHTVLTEFLTNLGVSELTAAEDACRIEHVISDKSFNAIKKFYKNKKKDL